MKKDLILIMGVGIPILILMIVIGGGGHTSSDIEIEYEEPIINKDVVEESKLTESTSNELIFTMIIMPPQMTEYINQKWTDDDLVTSEQPNALNKFPDKTRAIVITTKDNLDTAIQTAKKNGISYIAYNNEPNNGASSTPADEIKDAPNAIEEIAKIVHDQKLKFISAPSYGLMIKIVNQVNWQQVDPQIIVFQLQRATSVQQMISEFNEKSSIIRPQTPDSIFMLQVNPEWQSIDDVQNVLKSTSEIGAISIVCNTSACTPQYLDQIMALR